MTPAARAGAAPMLVCLNLQAAYLDPRGESFAPRAFATLAQAQACLQWARGQELPVVHVHTRAGLGRPAAPPIPGFEPRLSEPLVMKRSASIFDSDELERVRPRLEEAIVIGFSGLRDCVAAAIDAERAGARLVFVSDAIASTRLADHEPNLVDAFVAALISEWAPLVTTENLLRRDLRLGRLMRGIG